MLRKTIWTFFTSEIILCVGIGIGFVWLMPRMAEALTWDFNTEGDTEGWLFGTETEGSRVGLEVKDGVLGIDLHKCPPGWLKGAYLRSPEIRLDTALFDRLRIRLKVLNPDGVTIGGYSMHWMTSERDPYSKEDTSPYSIGRGPRRGNPIAFSHDEWQELGISGFAEEETWEGELIQFTIALKFGTQEVSYPDLERVLIDWITLTGPGEELFGFPEPSPEETRLGSLFSPYAFYPVGGEVKVVVSGDIDRDGDKDLVVGRSHTNSGLAVAWNDGSGGFLEQTSYTFIVGDNPLMLGIADFDGDEVMDMMVYKWGFFSEEGSSDPDYRVWWNDGRGHLLPGAQLENLFPLGLGDFDGDTDVDLLIIPLGGTLVLRVLLNTGAGSFEEHMDVDKSPRYGPTGVGDFDGDGDVDVLWRPLEEGAGYLLTLNDGTGHLTEEERWEEAFKPYLIQYVGDLDGDGDVDALITTGTTGPFYHGVVLLRNMGDGVFRRETIYEDIVMKRSSEIDWNIWAGDVNGDGRTDLAIPSFRDSEVRLLLGQPDGSFKEEGRYPVSGSPEDMVAADFDGDGDVDLVVADRMSEGVSILFNQIRQPVTDVEMDDHAGRPSTCRLGESYPNPFNAWTVIPFELAFSGRVRLAVYDVLGRKVRTLLDGERGKGRWTVRWDGRDALGREASSGVYVVRMEVGDFVDTQRIVLLR